ncbi:conserved repeat domain-containing protein [Dyadobacter sp. SG02]|nr:conserved repeat domain-containing protein [Dyadobacter sp. SG02]
MLFLSAVSPSFGQSPGGVSANLRIWLKADDGFTPSAWTDKSTAGNTYTQTNAGKQPTAVPASALFNFNPAVDFGGETSASAKFMVVPTGRPFTAASTNGSFFIMTRFNSDQVPANTAVSLGLGGTTTTATAAVAYNPVLSTYNDNATYNYMTWVYDGVSGNFGVAARPAADNLDKQVNLDSYSWTVGSNYFTGVNGTSVSQGQSAVLASSIKGNQGSQLGENFGRIANATIPEVIGYERDLTTDEKRKVNTYLAIKYGVTLIHDYISPSGAVLYSIADVYKNRVTSIGWESSEALQQKQSRSVHAGYELTIGLQNQIAASNAAHTGTFANDGAYEIVGDNGLDSLNNIFPSNQCYTETNINTFTNRVWKLTETGIVDSVKITLPDSSEHIAAFLASGEPVFMVVGDAADFNGNVKYVQGIKIGADWEFKYNFASSATSYFKFAGTVTAGTCISCLGGPQFSSPGLAYASPLYGNAIRTQNASGGAGDIVVNYELKDPHGAAYYPTYWPLPFGDWAYAYRYDNLSGPNSDMTWEIRFSKGTKPSFQIAGIDALYENIDQVTVVGYCGAQLILPKLSPAVGDNAYYTASMYNSYTLNANTATGRYYYVPNSPYSFTNVSFDKPIDRVEVIWKKASSTSAKYFQELAIGKMTLNCQKPATATCINPDDIYIDRWYDAPSTATCDSVILAMKIINKSCYNKTITLTDNIGVLAYVKGTVNAPGLTYGSINAYDETGTLTITDALITPGEHMIYARVYSPGGASGTYNHQTSFSVQGGGTGVSDDLSDNAGCQPTTITFTPSAQTVLPKITQTVDKHVYDAATGNVILTYTVQFENTSGSPVTGATLTDFAGDQAHFVAGSLSSSMGGTPNSYGTAGKENGMFIYGMTIPTGISTITFQVDTKASADTIRNTVMLQGDASSRCSSYALTRSNEVMSIPGSNDPDLKIAIQLDATGFSTGQARDFILRLDEVLAVTTTSAVTVRINKLSGWDLAVPGITLSATDQSGVSGSSAVAGGTANENGNWNFRENANFITITLKPGLTIAANGTAILGLTATRKAGTAPSSSQNLTATILTGSGGDTFDGNNQAVSKITTN